MLNSNILGKQMHSALKIIIVCKSYVKFLVSTIEWQTSGVNQYY